MFQAGVVNAGGQLATGRDGQVYGPHYAFAGSLPRLVNAVVHRKHLAGGVAAVVDGEGCGGAGGFYLVQC